MENLLRDLNIYAHNFMNCNLTFTYDGNRIRVQGDEIGPYVAESIILNKKFGFIQRLLNNQKIDQEKLDHSLDSCSYIKNDLAGSCIKLTMFLSIQDNPIEFLISILK